MASCWVPVRYFGVTFGIALGTGLISGVIHQFVENSTHDFSNMKLFSHDYGLFDSKKLR